MTEAVNLAAPPAAALTKGLREVIRQFTPNWFAATMGTGILSAALDRLPVQFAPLHGLAEALWVLNIGLFILFSMLYVARWLLHFDGARRIFDHPVMSMSLGCIPMGLATIINGFLSFGVQHFGHAAVEIGQTLWWTDAAMAAACGVAIPFMMFTRQSHGLEQMTAVWLLPIVAAEVASVSGGLLAPHMATAQSQLTVLVTSYVLWALSVPLAIGVLVILFLRMALHKLPPSSMAATSWLTLGPIGTGALGLLVLGQASPAIFASHGLASLGQAFLNLGIVGGLLMWAYGLWWLVMAALITVKHAKVGFDFNLGWWGYIFPPTAYALASLRLSSVLPVPAFAIFGALIVVAVAMLWVVVATRTLRGAWRGELFFAPCLTQA